MFEKDAEEIMMKKVIKENDCIMTPCKTLEDCQLCDFCFDDMVDAFKDGAEFGYNKAKEELEEKYKETICNSEMNLNSVTERLEELEKANEWHYVKDGDLPKHNHEVLCLMWGGTKEIGYYENEVWHFENFVADYEDVDYWQEIVLPELKESK